LPGAGPRPRRILRPMGLLATIKRNGRLISDALAGTPAYFELATTNLSLYRVLRRVAAQHARGRLLDAGAGRMAYRRMLQRFCETYEGLDVSDPAGRMDHVADLQKTGLPDGQYDTIVCTQVLHHLPEPGQALREIARMLKPGGKVILSVPHLVWMHNEPRDYWRFTVHGVRFLLERCGLEVVSVEGVGGLVCFLAYAPSAALLGLLWGLRPAFRVALLANRVFVRLVLLLDRAMGVKSLYPTNIVAVARKRS